MIGTGGPHRPTAATPGTAEPPHVTLGLRRDLGARMLIHNAELSRHAGASDRADGRYSSSAGEVQRRQSRCRRG